MKKYIITPQLGSSHDVYFTKIAKEKNLKEFTRFRHKTKLKNFSFNEIFFTLLRWFKILPMLFINWILYKDIRKLKYKDINIGFSVNEWCIVRSTNAKANFLPILKISLKSILIYTVLNKEFKKNNIGYILGASEPYPLNSIFCQLGVRYGIPVRDIRGNFTLITHEYNIKTLTSAYDQIFKKENYKSIYGSEYQFSKNCLDKQVKGQRDHINYFLFKRNYQKLSLNLKDYVIIFCHDFFDAPGFYGGNIFPNHYDWLVYTIKYLSKYNIKIALKIHPNESYSSSNVVKKLKSAFPYILLIYQDIPLIEFKKNDIYGIITVYGTIQFEAAYLRIPTVCACDQNYINVSNYSKSITEYNENLHKLVIRDGLYIPKKDFVIKSFYLFSKFILFSVPIRNTPILPFEDVPIEIWKEVFNKEFPLKWNERRETFMHSKKFKSYLKNKVENINLVEMLSL